MSIDNQVITPEQILSPESKVTSTKNYSIGWTIFWLVVFTPTGIWRVVKSNWSLWLKLTVIISTGLIFLFLTYETIVLPFQLASSLLNQ